ncbi:MAG: hypothetical protein QME58_02455 [Bacteroidota bacterium]|nr:hypothetical protein [Bacteroidota bacterium]
MNKEEIRLILIVFLVCSTIITVKEIFTVYSVDVETNPHFLFPDGNSTTTISVVSLNRFGFGVPFRAIKTEFVIIEGYKNIEILSKEANKLTIKSRYEVGKVIVLIKNEYTLIPIKVEIPIIKPTA